MSLMSTQQVLSGVPDPGNLLGWGQAGSLLAASICLLASAVAGPAHSRTPQGCLPTPASPCLGCVESAYAITAYFSGMVTCIHGLTAYAHADEHAEGAKS